MIIPSGDPPALSLYSIPRLLFEQSQSCYTFIHAAEKRRGGCNVTISFELPHDIAQRICTSGVDLSDKAREAFLVDLYREDAITHGQLSKALGLDGYDTDGVLKKHGVFLEINVEELRAEAAALHDVSPK
jgi:predicted HTH domain antitoxin